MLGSTHHSRWGQRVVAGLLLVLYALLFVLPLAAAAPESRMGRMACCRPGKKCCCRRNAPANAIVSGKACGGRCDQSAAVAKVALELFPVAVPAAAPELRVATSVSPSDDPFVVCGAAYSLRQRPPPAIA